MSDFVDLREKYRTMRALREERDRALAANIPHTPSRDMLRALSQRWPGVLAEIDRIAPDVLHDRIAILDSVIEKGTEPPVWARAWILAHARLRGALAIKFQLRGGRSIDPGHVFPEDSGPYLDRIAEIERPPNGRLVDLVFADVAKLVGVDPRDLREILMPRPESR